MTICLLKNHSSSTQITPFLLIEKATFIGSKTFFFLKTAKMVSKILSLANLCFQELTFSLVKISESLKENISIIQGVGCFSLIADLITPNKTGKYFLFDLKNSKSKRIAKIISLARSMLMAIVTAGTYGLIQLGMLTKYAIGNFPVFKLVIDSFSVAIAFIGIAESISCIGVKEEKNINSFIDISGKTTKILGTSLSYISLAFSCVAAPLLISIAACGALSATLGFINIYIK